MGEPRPGPFLEELRRRLAERADASGPPAREPASAVSVPPPQTESHPRGERAVTDDAPDPRTDNSRESSSAQIEAEEAAAAPTQLMARSSARATDPEAVFAAIRDVFTQFPDGLERDLAIVHIARLLGFARTGTRIATVLREAMAAAVRRDILLRNGKVYVLRARSIGQYSREELKKALLAAMGRGWIEQNEAIRLGARRLGFGRVGSVILTEFRSAISGSIRQGRIERDGTRLRVI